MSAGAIEFACPYCERITRVPATFAGKQGKCPGCQRVIEVPNPALAEDAVATLPTPGPSPAARAGDDAGVANTSVSTKVPAGGGADVPSWQKQNVRADADEESGDAAPGGTKPCPFCGEQIKSVAKKCKFCGEFLDKRLAANRRPGGGGGSHGALANPGTRFLSALIDGAMLAGCWMVTMFGFVIGAGGRGNNEPAGLLVGLVGVALVLGLVCYQWYLVSTRGQSLAKGWLGIKIVKLDGSDVDFVHGVVLRVWAYQAIGFIPYIGGCIQLLGYLAIFADDRRCLHDHIASTRVIEVGSDRR